MMKLSQYGIPLILGLFIFVAWRTTPEAPSRIYLPQTPPQKSIAPVVQKDSPPVAPQLPAPTKTTDQMIKVPLDAQLLLDLKPQMMDFIDLKAMVIKKEGDKEKWTKLLKNPHAIYRARKLLLAPTDEQRDLQNQALEFLIEAMKSGNPNAQDALTSLIADQTIEGGNADRVTQQFKAELKAEALYAWSSYSPDQDVRLIQLLPGPVSQRIWQNVIAQQMNNQIESELTP